MELLLIRGLFKKDVQGFLSRGSGVSSPEVQADPVQTGASSHLALRRLGLQPALPSVLPDSGTVTQGRPRGSDRRAESDPRGSREEDREAQREERMTCDGADVSGRPVTNIQSGRPSVREVSQMELA
ncbi:unnamed protein product [Boreogadus saida]